MLTTQPNSDHLIDLLKQQQELYDKSMQLVTQFQSTSGSQSNISEQLQLVMRQVGEIDSQIAALRPELEKNGSLKSAYVQRAVNEQEQILRLLIGKVNESLGHVSQQQLELSQSLDGNASRDTMQAAYKISMRTG